MKLFSHFVKAYVLPCAALALAAHSPLIHATEIPAELKDIGIEEKLGSQVAINELTFKDESGQEVKLSQYFHTKKPVILTMVYYECPNLCNFLLNGLVDSMKPFNWTPGQEFDVISVSINPKEGPALAVAKKEAYLKSYGRPEAAEGWHFLTSSTDQAKRLADQLGFKYRYVEKEKQYAHSAALFVLTPEGKISRYLYGISFSEKDLRLSLLEASSGKIGTIIDRIILFCYRYNPATRKYSIYLTQLMQFAGLGTVLLFGGYMATFWYRQRKLNQGERHV